MKLPSLVIAALTASASLFAAAPADDTKPASAAFVENLRADKPQTVVYYGTSLTAGGAWTRLLTEDLKAKFPGLVVAHNSGGPGTHSGWGVDNVNARVIAHAPDVVFIEFSINDAVARFNMSQAKAKENLNKMIDRIQTARPECEVILQVMNPVIDRPEGDSGWRPELPAYQENYRQVAKERGLKVIDHMPAWSELLKKDGARFRIYIPDGVHPAEEGWRQIVMPELRRQIGL